jgi:predicted kinase
MKVVILQGIPGIGKSTYTRKFETALVCSADDYMFEDGVYVWRADKLGYCHAQCFSKFKNGLDNKIELIFVDNTNTRAREIKPYIKLAKDNNYEVEILWLRGDPEIFGPRNTHGVAIEYIRLIQKRLEDFNLPRTIIDI